MMPRRFGTYVNRDFYVPLPEHKKLQDEVEILLGALADIAFSSDMTLKVARSKAKRIYEQSRGVEQQEVKP